MLENRHVAITTIDNPYDPFEEFTLWYLYDVEKQYNTCSYLARIVRLSEDMTQKEEDEEVERAIDRMIELDFMNIYVKVRKGETNIAEINKLNENNNKNSEI